jgi:glutamine amidotransferase-like uncharacterized protein
MKRSVARMMVWGLAVLWIISCNRIAAGDIGLYAGEGTAESCITATHNMFEWMGYSVVLIDADVINTGGLSDFRVICVPGGDMYEYGNDISNAGKENIRQFVTDGGGYIGICGGAYFTGHTVYWQGDQIPMTPLALFPGTTSGPIHDIAPYPDCVMCKIDICDHLHPITESEPDTAWIMYCYGPRLMPDVNAQVDILGVYDITNDPAMIAFTYGDGRVFIIGTHPEYEEDSDRDGLTGDNEHNDRGSDWDLMKRATLWCVGEIDSL